MAPFEVSRVTPQIGAEVSGVDLEPGIGDATIAEIRAALLEHKVLFFRRQSLDAASLTKLASRFGEPTPAHPVEPSVEGHPEVLALDSEEGARADVWHSDLTFQERPPLGALLFAEEVPSAGGDTLWTDMCGAYDALSPAMRAFLATLTATHSPSKAGDYFAARDVGGDKAAATAGTRVGHPVIRAHPEHGKSSVFVNPLFTDKIDGLRRAESEALLEMLHAVAVRPELTVRWRWETGDLAFWDNRCTMHYALRDFGAARRNMLRVALEGDRPVGATG
ncbi:MAG TPA: TauD/TfdA family dioxygenase [Acidimicrobiales bacterium]|nr:TauD/TfdA family dioxygenase [Acidimicrobiales bacterium]